MAGRYTLYITYLLLAITGRPGLAQISHTEGLTKAPPPIDSSYFDSGINSAVKVGKHYPDSGVVLLKNLYQESYQKQYTFGQIKTALALSDILMKLGRYKEALIFVKTGLSYCTEDVHPEYLTSFYNNMGNIFYYLADFKASANAFYKALQYKDTYSGILPFAYIYNNLAGTLVELKEHDKALYFLGKAREDAQLSRDSVFIANLLINMGSLYFDIQELDKSEPYLLEAAALSSKINDPEKLHLAYISLGNLYKSQYKSQLALKYLHDAYELAEQKSLKRYGRSFNLSSIAEVYAHQKNYRQAKEYFNRALKEADGLANETSQVLAKLSEMYAAMGNFERAYDYYRRYTGLKDSIKSSEVALSVNELETRFRTAEKDNEIKTAKLSLTEQEVKIARGNLLILAISLGALLIFCILMIWIYARNKKIKIEKSMLQLRARIEGEEEERARMAHELHDGINSQLTAVKSFILAAQSEYPHMKDAPEFIAAKEILSETAADVRNIAHNLAPDNLLQTGLVAVTASFCEKIFDPAGIKFDLDTYGDFSSLNTSLSLSIYRIIQELSNNIVKHADATYVTILLTYIRDELKIIVEDNGKGIPEAQLSHSGIGLRSVKNRIRMYGGEFITEIEKNKRTTITITFSVKEKENRDSYEGQISVGKNNAIDKLT